MQNFNGANLEEAYFIQANLTGARLINADLQKSNLNEARLNGSFLSGANFFRAELIGANFSFSDLSHANLSKARLMQGNFQQSILDSVDFSNSFFGATIFAFTDLSTCIGLEKVIVENPCSVDLQTLQNSKNISRSFLKKIGLPDLYIDYIPEFIHTPINLYPVFLSHSWANKEFARKLYDSLIEKGVIVWFDEKQMKPGDKIIGGISKGINTYDKLILICSEASLNSWWIKEELERILEKERHFQSSTGKSEGLLIPITIDDYIFQSNDEYAVTIRKNVVGDFKEWQDKTNFEKSLDALIKALNPNRPGAKPQSLLGLK